MIFLSTKYIFDSAILSNFSDCDNGVGVEFPKIWWETLSTVLSRTRGET